MNPGPSGSSNDRASDENPPPSLPPQTPEEVKKDFISKLSLHWYSEGPEMNLYSGRPMTTPFEESLPEETEQAFEAANVRDRFKNIRKVVGYGLGSIRDKQFGPANAWAHQLLYDLVRFLYLGQIEYSFSSTSQLEIRRPVEVLLHDIRYTDDDKKYLRLLFEAENREVNEEGNELMTWHRIPTKRFANLNFSDYNGKCLYDHGTAIVTAPEFASRYFMCDADPTHQGPLTVKPPLIIQTRLLGESLIADYDVYPNAFRIFDLLTEHRPWLFVLKSGKAREVEKPKEPEQSEEPQKRKRNRNRNNAKKSGAGSAK